MRQAVEGVRDLVAAIAPADARERADRADCLSWLAATSDIYRRAKPATPPRHLVSYALPVDPADGSVFLVDHRLAGLWLPPGGHVEPREDPAATARREAREELGIEADFALAGALPFFVTVTQTVGLAGEPDQAAAGSHTDVSLWYLLAGTVGMLIAADPREFAAGRWWTQPEIQSAGPGQFDPCLGRFLAKLRTFAGRAGLGFGHGDAIG
jgi:8-oxo-dGTP diphosphatase